MLNTTVEDYIKSQTDGTGSLVLSDNQIKLDAGERRLFFTSIKIREIIYKLGELCNSTEVDEIYIIYTETAFSLLIKESNYSPDYTNILLSNTDSSHIFYYRRRNGSLNRKLPNAQAIYQKAVDILLEYMPSLSLVTKEIVP